MSQYNSLPFLVINYGVETIYVLHSRLVAQKVSQNKVDRIVTDLATSMLSTSFLDELFRPQKLYSEKAARSLISTICDASIIHLDQTSMHKLYDLVAVGVKYQLISLHHPMELIEMTLNHLDGLQAIAPACKTLIAGARERLERLFTSTDVGGIAAIRHQLLNFSNRCRIRGSLLLEKGFQKSDGTFCIPPISHVPPTACNEAPGTISYYTTDPPSRETFSHPFSAITVQPSVPRGAWNPFHTSRIGSAGTSMYDQANASSNKTVEAPVQKTVPPSTVVNIQPPEKDDVSKKDVEQYEGEVAFLCRLVGAQNQAPKMDRIQLDFFQDATDTGAPSRPAQQSNAVPEPSTTRMTTAAIQKENKQLINIIGGLKTTSAQNGNNDLLDIMDSL